MKKLLTIAIVTFGLSITGCKEIAEVKLDPTVRKDFTLERTNVFKVWDSTATEASSNLALRDTKYECTEGYAYLRDDPATPSLIDPVPTLNEVGEQYQCSPDLWISAEITNRTLDVIDPS